METTDPEINHVSEFQIIPVNTGFRGTSNNGLLGHSHYYYRQRTNKDTRRDAKTDTPNKLRTIRRLPEDHTKLY